MALAFAPFGKEVKIVEINTNDKIQRHLANLGLLVGSPITAIVDNGGDVILQVKDGRLALNKSLAMRIQVA